MNRSALSLILAIAMAVGCGRVPAANTVARDAANRAQAAVPAFTSVPFADGVRKARHYSDVLFDTGNDWLRLMGLSSSIDLSTVALDGATSQPGMEVTVQNVPTNLGKVRVAILAPDGGTFSWAMLRDLGEPNRIGLMAPVLPQEIAPDGELHLVVYVREARSPVQSLHLDAVPPAPANTGSQALISKLSETVDVGPVEGNASSSLAPIAHALLDDPGNPESLSQVLQAQQAENPDFVALVDGILATTGVVQALDHYKDAAAALERTSASAETAGYRTQWTGPYQEAGSAGQAVAMINDQNALLSSLEDTNADVLGAISAAIAALESAGPVKDKVAVLLNELALLKHLETVYRASTLPSRVTLYYPTFSGDCGTIGPKFFYESSPCSNGHWGVYGEITNTPISVSAADAKGLITSSKADLLKRYLDILAHVTSPSPWEAMQRLIGGNAQAYLDLLSFLLAESTANVGLDLRPDPNSNSIIVGRPFRFFHGDLGAFSKASFENPPLWPVIQATGTPGDRAYKILRGAGDSFAIRVETDGSFFPRRMPASAIYSRVPGQNAGISEVRISRASFELRTGETATPDHPATQSLSGAALFRRRPWSTS